MSYDIEMQDPETNEALWLNNPRQLVGCNQQVGGSREASISITYNYANIFARVLPENESDTGIRCISGLTGNDSIPILESAVSQLGDDVSSNYWEATEGNAKLALSQLLEMAKSCPKGVWAVY